MLKHTLILLISVLIFANNSGAENEERAQWLVVTAPAFKADLAPLLKHRRAEGLQVKVIETDKFLTPAQLQQGDAAPLQARLQELCQRHKGPTYILLAGVAAALDPPDAERIVVPSLSGTIGRMKDQPSDHGFGLPDADGSSTIAVGRFPARTPEEFRAMVSKTLGFETDPDQGSWRNRLVLLVGDPGGGSIAGMVVEQAVNPRLVRLDPFWSMSAILNISASRYYLPDSCVHDAIVQTLEQGQLFSVFLGHSSAPSMWLTGNKHFTGSDWSAMHIVHGPGVFFTCGCFACQADTPDRQAYGLAIIRNPAGPAAVIGPTGESWSAPGQLAVDGLLANCSKPPLPSRLGDYWLGVQAGLARGEIPDGTFKMYDQFDGTKGMVPLSVQRLEHLEMWTLLGDPALRLPLLPPDVSLEVAGPVSEGKILTVNGVLPRRLKGAPVRITLERTLSAKPTDLEKLPPNSPENRVAREQVAIENNRRANNVVLVQAEARVNGNRFSCPLEVPATLPWSNVVIRAYSGKKHEVGMGVIELPVAK